MSHRHIGHVVGGNGTALLLSTIVGHSISIADHAALETLAEFCDVEPERSNAECTWFDTRPLLSPQEHSAVFIDRAAQLLAYARMRQLIYHHPHHTHLVRFAHQAGSPE